MSNQLQALNSAAAHPTTRRGSVVTSKIVVPALSLLMGLAYAFVVLGPRPLNPFNLSWMIGDPSTAYLGWAFFRQETHLTFPFGWSHAIGYPLGVSVAYFDSIPLVATAAWVVRDVLPKDFQYFGMYFALCAALQFYFGFCISRQICRDDLVAGALGASLFLISPIFMQRVGYGHFALASQWLVLAGLDQFLHTTGRPSRTQVLQSVAVCFIAGGINPYIAAMVFLVSCGTYARPLMSGEKCFRQSSLGVGVALCSALLGLAVFGFIRTDDISQYVGVGYGFYSMNLLAPIDPQVYGSLVFRQQQIGPGQYEGYNYLGLGLLLLGVVSIARKPSSLRNLLRRRTVPLLMIFGVSLVLALSTTATVGPHILYQIVLPKPIMNALTSLRVSGRLFWPGYYVIFIGVIASAFRAFRGRWLHVALSAALILQFFDLRPRRAAIHQLWQSASAAAVPTETAWHDLGRTQRHLVLVPPWQCSPGNAPGGAAGYSIFGRVAVEQRMTINSFYAGRYSDMQRTFFCHDQIEHIRQDGLRKDTAYVFTRSMDGELVGLQYGGNYCRYEGQYILCSYVTGRSGLDPAILQGAQILHRGDIISFAGANKMADRLIGWGWSVPESWGRWMLGHAATLVFRLSDQPSRDLRIDVSVVPFIPPTHPRQNVEIVANDRVVAQQTFEKGGVSDIQVVIPKDVIGSSGLVQLRLNSADPASPAALGLSGDARELSIGITRLRIDDAEDRGPSRPNTTRRGG